MSDDKNLSSETSSNSANGGEAKNIAIIAHITIIGLIIAYVMHSKNKTELGSFYIRQMIGICIVGFALSIIGGILASIVSFLSYVSLIAAVLWVISLLGALSGEKKLLPVVGEHFQNWFKSI